METTINERIRLILKEFNYKSVRSFASKIGISQTSFNDIINGAEPKFSTLEKIMKAEPSINAEWLLTGNGEVFKTNYQNEVANSTFCESNVQQGNNNKLNDSKAFIELQKAYQDMVKKRDEQIDRLLGIIEVLNK